MTYFKYFSNSYYAELLKLRRTFAVKLCIISAFLIPTIFFIYYSVDKSKLAIEDSTINPWNAFINKSNGMVSGILIPLFIVLFIALIFQIENNAKGQKLLFSLPIPKWSIYFGKLASVITLLIITYLGYLMALLICGLLLGAIFNEYNFLEHSPNLGSFIKFLGTHFLAMLGIIGIQFWMSFKIQNTIIPISIGMILVIGAIFINSQEFSQYFPYAFGFYSQTSKTDILFNVLIISGLSFTLSSLFGYLNISKTNITN